MARRSRSEIAAKAAAEAVAQAESAVALEPEQVEQVAQPKDEKPANPPKLNTDHQDAIEELVALRNKPEEAPTAEPEASAEPVVEEPVAETAEPEFPKMVTVKVDGEEFQVSQTEIDEAGGVGPYRIMRAAENRLKKANDTLAESRRLHAEAIENSKKSTPKEPVVTDDEFMKSKMDVIRFGTPEESAAAMREVSMRLNPKVDTNQIVLQATVNFNHDNALAKFRADYADVVGNPILSKLIQPLAAEALTPYRTNDGSDWGKLAGLNWNEFYENLGNKIRGASKPSQPQPPVQDKGNPSPTSEKEAKKAANVVTLPTAGARAVLPKEEKEPSREDILNDMKKSRGQLTG